MNVEPLNRHKIRKAGPSDAELLVELGKRAFHEAFAEQTAPEDMEMYLNANFTADKTAAQMNDKRSL